MGLIQIYEGAEVIWYPDQAKRAIAAKVAARVRDAGNMLRRTVRLAVNQKVPQVKRPGPDGTQTLVVGRSRPGDVPYRESGRLYDAVGYDFSQQKASLEIDATISVESHGLETGRASASTFHGRPAAAPAKRPHLLPAWERSKALMAAIIEGRTAAPQYGDLSFARHRQPLVVLGPPRRRWARGVLGKLSQVLKAARGIFSRRRLKLSHRVRFVGPGTGWVAIRHQLIRTKGKRK